MLTEGRPADDPEAAALSWHRNKHSTDHAEGFDRLTQGRLQIAHVRSWPAIKALSRSFPQLIAERRFHCLDNVLLLCPEAHDLYDGAGLFGTDLVEKSARLTWVRPEARGPLMRYLYATVGAHAGHQTENTNLLMAAEVLRSAHNVETRQIVAAFEERCRVAMKAVERGDHTKTHRGDVAVLSMPKWAPELGGHPGTASIVLAAQRLEEVSPLTEG
ncbi:hypothetical protein ABT154_25375 [Streptomyces sp. NPDC001728]|uniref:hypothetical protein n=1 Tax=Streptomyces sp. NPDC001728 TaxID=3154396 RepID=UPI003330C0DD